MLEFSLSISVQWRLKNGSEVDGLMGPKLMCLNEFLISRPNLDGIAKFQRDDQSPKPFQIIEGQVWRNLQEMMHCHFITSCKLRILQNCIPFETSGICHASAVLCCTGHNCECLLGNNSNNYCNYCYYCYGYCYYCSYCSYCSYWATGSAVTLPPRDRL